MKLALICYTIVLGVSINKSLLFENQKDQTLSQNELLPRFMETKNFMEIQRKFGWLKCFDAVSGSIKKEY